MKKDNVLAILNNIKNQLMTKSPADVMNYIDGVADSLNAIEEHCNTTTLIRDFTKSIDPGFGKPIDPYMPDPLNPLKPNDYPFGPTVTYDTQGVVKCNTAGYCAAEPDASAAPNISYRGLDAMGVSNV